MTQDITDAHRALLTQIEQAKAAPKRDHKLITKLARKLTRLDDRTPLLKAQTNARRGAGHTRSPSFGRWNKDDE